MNVNAPSQRQPPRQKKKSHRAWWLFFLLWTPFAAWACWHVWNLPPGSSRLVESGFGDGGEAWWQLFHRNFHRIYPWILFAPFVLILCRKFPLGLRATMRVAPLLLLAAVLFVAASLALEKKLARNLSPLVVIDARVTAKSVAPQPQPQPVFSVAAHSVKAPDSPPSFELNPRSTDKPPHSTDIPIQIVRTAKSDGVVLEVHFTNPDNQTPGERETKHKRLTPRKLVAAGVHLGGFLLLAGIAHAGTYYRRYRDREQQSIRLAAQVNEARLARLQTQLQPHFLFNSLNGISSFVHEQPDRAIEMITHLSDLLRLSLTQSTHALIPLRKELEILDHYLELQEMRFGDRLRIVREIAPGTLDLAVPPFVLQPLTENAIRHGIEPLSRPGTLLVRSLIDDRQRLVLNVQDDGTGLSDSPATAGTGTGLSNLAERLDTLLPDRHRLQIAPGPGGGTVVTLTLTDPQPPPREQATQSP